jgi:hypothetical protein
MTTLKQKWCFPTSFSSVTALKQNLAFPIFQFNDYLHMYIETKLIFPVFQFSDDFETKLIFPYFSVQRLLWKNLAFPIFSSMATFKQNWSFPVFQGRCRRSFTVRFGAVHSPAWTGHLILVKIFDANFLYVCFSSEKTPFYVEFANCSTETRLGVCF